MLSGGVQHSGQPGCTPMKLSYGHMLEVFARLGGNARMSHHFKQDGMGTM